jgi:hypothetical protein
MQSQKEFSTAARGFIKTAGVDSFSQISSKSFHKLFVTPSSQLSGITAELAHVFIESVLKIYFLLSQEL